MSSQSWLVLPLALAAIPALQDAGRDATEARLQQCVEEHARSSDADAFAVQVLIGEESLFEAGHGRVRADAQRDASVDTTFAVAPMAHAWLATALLRKVRTGDLALDTHAVTLLPELLPESSPVRVVELMHQTSGLADYRDHAPAKLLAGGPSYAEIMATVMDIAPVNAPNECVTETATNTLLLAALVEVVYESAADEALHEAIFAPLEMNSTGYLMTAVAREAGAEASASPAFLASGLRSTADDLARYARGVIDRRVLGTEGVEQLKGAAQLADGSLANSGMGVRLIELGDHPGHLIGGPSAVVAHIPAHDLVVALAGMGQSPDLEELAWQLARTVVAHHSPEVLDLPLTPDEQAPYLGSYQIGCTTVIISADGARLVLDEVDRGKTLLLNQGEHRFVARDGGDVQVEFEFVGETADSFVLIRNGLRSIAKRLGRDG